MNVLGLDSSTAASAACVLRSDGEPFESEPSPQRLGGPPGHARELLPAAVACLDAAGLRWDQLDAIAVGVGPGTFTGLRVGVATARALAAAHGAELRAVSSLAALAWAVAAPDAGEGPHPGANGSAPVAGRPVLAAIDARRGELYASLYQGERRLWEPFAATPEDVAERLREAQLPALAVGDGALRFRDALAGAGGEVADAGSRLHVVRALAVCRLGLAADPLAPEAVVPEYLRAPDAKPRAR